MTKLAFAGFLMLVACGSSAPKQATFPAPPAGTHLVDGNTGEPLSLEAVAKRSANMDVVMLGEIHGHQKGLQVGADLFEVLTTTESTALSLEFFERDTQGALDAYLRGDLDKASFLKQAKRSDTNYPPGHERMVETAKRLGLPVIAANAPREYAKLARTDGYEALRALPKPQQALFVIPEVLPSGRYREEFDAMMGGHGDPHTDPHHAMNTNGFFEAQALWDATMANSVNRALKAHRHPVFHVVGKFHTDFDGGTVQMLKRQAPQARVLTLSMVETPGSQLAEEDRGRADVIVLVESGK